MLLYAPKRPSADLPPVRVNLYSDTQTRPSPAMKDAMVRAEVGDEQHGDDPTVHRAMRPHGSAAGEGGGGVPALGHDVQPDRDPDPLPRRR